jgi:hypothetical protein
MEFTCECATTERTRYIVVTHTGERSIAAYCDECAALARADWNGEIESIEECCDE